nr:MAG TPA: holin [Caudoviricetes sp.]
MFKNCVFKVSVNTKKWVKAAVVRAIKTMAQSAIAAIGVSTTIGTVDWKVVASTAVVTGILSLLTSVAGLPEVESKEV